MVRQLRDEAPNPRGMQRHGNPVWRDVDPLDQQPENANLLGWVQLVPHRLKRAQRVNHLGLLKHGVLRRILPAHRGDGPRDRLGPNAIKASDLAEHKPINSRAGSSTLLALVRFHLSAGGVAQALLCEPNKALAETLAVTREESNDRENEEACVL